MKALRLFAFAMIVGATLNPASAATPQTPDLIFAGKTAAQASGLIASGCLDRSWPVARSEDRLVECNRPGVPKSMVLLGPGGASWAVVVRYTLIELPAGTRVQVQQRIESENRLGIKTTHEGKIDGDPGEASALLVAAGAVPYSP